MLDSLSNNYILQYYMVGMTTHEMTGVISIGNRTWDLPERKPHIHERHSEGGSIWSRWGDG